MICFRLSLNGEYCTTAGIPGHAVLSSHLTWVRRDTGPRRRGLPDESLDLSLGGLDSNVVGDDPVSVSWYQGPLHVGDRVLFEVLDLEQADPPLQGHRRPPPSDAEKLRSAKHYLRVYKQQRRALDTRIRDHEAAVARYEAVGGRKTTAAVRKGKHKSPRTRRP
jgi:hypothetical protein